MPYIKVSSEELEKLNQHIEESGYTPVLPVYYYKQVEGKIYCFDSKGFPCRIEEKFLEELKESGRLISLDGDQDEKD